MTRSTRLSAIGVAVLTACATPVATPTVDAPIRREPVATPTVDAPIRREPVKGLARAIIDAPVPLTSTDPRYQPYLDAVRGKIKERWSYPCLPEGFGRDQCTYKSAELTLDFGIAKDGTVTFVTVVRSSGYRIYDDVAINAVKLAAPFEPVPDAMGVRGVVIRATMQYVLTPDLPR